MMVTIFYWALGLIHALCRRSGRVLFSATSNHSLLADNYKSRPIAAYHDPTNSPFLDHYRLRVPKYRSIIELLNFSILLFLFVLCIGSEYDVIARAWATDLVHHPVDKNFAKVEWTELIFGIYTCGFILDEFAASQVCLVFQP